MSRSYKKVCCCPDKNSKFGKRMANRKVRIYKGTIANGKSHRKLYCSWDIRDYVFRHTFEEYKRNFYGKSKTEKELYRSWYKYYKAK
ncbi:hypothetical protein [Clostridium cavendishii]|uniref:hypothetical protein n=1 Tax=Clostridium cavendishii TaxID=349931 RepID=UPI000932444D|nr:hypothetical protein [Clostridium cavendishii]